MVMTGYKGVSVFPKAMPFQGGLCQWWFTPVENIALWPEVSPLTQKMRGEPQLNSSAVWYGPVNVSDKSLGYTETQDALKGLPYYKQKVEGILFGAVDANHVNLENMAYHKFVVVGKTRTAGLYLVIGCPVSPLDFDADADTGKGGNYDEFSTKLTFTGESINKAFLIDYFSGDWSQAPQASKTNYSMFYWGAVDDISTLNTEAAIEALSFSSQFVSGQTIVADFRSFTDFKITVMAEPKTEPVKVLFFASGVNNGSIGKPDSSFGFVIVGKYRLYYAYQATRFIENKVQFIG